MRVGLALPSVEVDGHISSYQNLRDMALEAECAGLDSLWVYDHLIFRFGDRESGVWEAWTLLSALAEATTRIRLGSFVLSTTFRKPGLVAKMAATLAEISDSRFTLGIGSGWHEPEHRAFGLPFENRTDRFEEAIAIISPLVREGVASRAGTFESVVEATLNPRPNVPIPILVGAKGPRMLELTATHADIWNAAWFGWPSDDLDRLLDSLRAACNRVGRRPDTLELTVGITVSTDNTAGGSLDRNRVVGLAELPDALEEYTKRGISEIICDLQPATPEAIQSLALQTGLSRRPHPVAEPQSQLKEDR